MLCIVHQKITKNLIPDNGYRPKRNAQAKIDPQNTKHSTSVTTFLGSLFPSPLEAFNFIFADWVIIWLQHSLQMNT